MNLLALILIIVVVGMILWAINAYVPMQDGMKKLLNAVVVIVMIIWIISRLFPQVSSVKL